MRAISTPPSLRLNELYRQHPEWQQGHSCMASAYMAKNNYDAAVEQLKIAVHQNPGGANEHRVLGQVLCSTTSPRRRCTSLKLRFR